MFFVLLVRLPANGTDSDDNLFLLFPASVGQTRNLDRKNFETALLGKRAQFQCSVQSPNAAEVEIWWEFEGRNITQDDEHYEVLVTLVLGVKSWHDANLV